MAENERVQLKREEVVGNEVVLSDIAPITNTESVNDSAKGIKLAQTLDKIWNDINNKLSRVVNSVNGRTGVVVLDSSDVGLENVDNVSFDDIKKWVITRIKQEFDNHILQLFDTLEEADQFAASHDESFHGTPFFSTHGRASENELRSVIGYFYWDMGSGRLTYESRKINTIGGTDNSIIYNEYVNGHDFRGGRIGVNIYKYEDALKLYNATSGEAATQSSLEESGLYIDKDVLAHEVFLFDGCYSPTSFNTFLAKQAPASNPRIIDIWIDGSRINLGGNFYLDSSLHIKKYDIIICNFADLPEYHESDGSIKDGIYPALITGQPAIGQVVSAPDRDHPTTQYAVRFFTLRPKVDFGLAYFHQDGTDNENGEYGDTLDHAHPSILGVKPTTGYVEGVSSGNEVINVSGLSVTGTRGKATNEQDHTTHNRQYSTVFPHGSRTVYTSMEKTTSGTTGGVSIIPDVSLCVIPNGYENRNELKNYPIKRAGTVDDETGNVNTLSNLSVNLLKWRQIDENSNETYAINLSGLSLVGPSETVSVTDPTNPTEQILLDGDHHSGGLRVNTGKFLGISDPPASVPDSSSYFSTGKVELRVADVSGLGDAGDNKLAISLPTNPSGGMQQGGLWITPDNDLSIQLGVGVAFTHRDRFGHINESPYTCICASVIDRLTSPSDIYDSENPDMAIDKNYIGGLRYIQRCGNYNGAIGIRVNEVTAWKTEGEPLNGGPTRIGSHGLQITDANVLSVQFAKDTITNRKNPMSIKTFTERDIMLMLDPPFNGKKEVFVGNNPLITVPDNPTTGILYNYNGEYYVFSIETGTCSRAIEYVSADNPKPMIGDPSKIYVDIMYADDDKGDPTPAIDAFVYREADEILMPDLVQSGTITPDSDDPTHPGCAQLILHEYSLRAGPQAVAINIYFDRINNKIYSDPARTQEVTPVDQKLYYDNATSRPYPCFIYDASTSTFSYTTDYYGNPIDETWLKKADVNFDKAVDASDGTCVLAFLGKCNENIYTNDLPGWKSYVHDEFGVDISHPEPYYENIMKVNSNITGIDDADVIPGVNLDYNIYQGLTVNNRPDGSYTTNDTKPLLSVNIHDDINNNSGYKYLNGGLRFATNGTLAVRINTNTDYDSTNPNKRIMHENSGYSADDNAGVNGISKDDLSRGTKGLRIYPSNVLGIQVDTSRGDLVFDSDGNLVISDEWAPGGKTLTIGNVGYNGTENVTIQIGPGLKLE